MIPPSAIDTELAALLERRTDAIAEATVLRCRQLAPELEQRYGEQGRRKCIQDVGYHLAYLSNAVAVSCPELFADYLAGAKVLLLELGLPTQVVANSVDALKYVLHQELSPEMEAVLEPYFVLGMHAMESAQEDFSRPQDDGQGLSKLAGQYRDILLTGNRTAATRLVLDAIEAGTSVQDIYLEVFQRSQYEIGRMWQTRQISMGQEHLCTAATQLIMSQLYPYVFTSKKNGRVLVAACVGGDLHEIGCRMVADFFEMEGWDTFYFGASTPTARILEALRERRADVLAISVTMTFHIRAVMDLIASVRAAEIDWKVTILVGGYPFKVDPDLWRKVGADGYARDAREAVALAGKAFAV